MFEERCWTWREVQAEVDRVARGLMAAGVGSGDHVAVWMTNRPEWLFILFAVGKVGACLVPLNTRYRSRDMAYCLEQSQCSALIYAERSGPIDYGAILAEVAYDFNCSLHSTFCAAYEAPRRGIINILSLIHHL